MTLAAHAHAKRPDGRARAPGRSLAGRALGHGHLQRGPWPVPVAHMRYVGRGHPTAHRPHGPVRQWVGLWVGDLRSSRFISCDTKIHIAGKLLV